MAAFDTRTRVREIADKLAAAGTAPTSSLVRKLLGKGSFATILDELKAWQAERGYVPPANPTAGAMERVGAQHAAELIAQAADMSKELATAVAAAKAAAASISAFPTQIAALTEQMAALTRAFEADRAAMREELARANHRYEGVQKYAMTAIEAARSETRILQEQLAKGQDKTGSREAAYRQQCDELRVIIHRLQGRLEEKGRSFDDVALPARHEFGDKEPVRLSSSPTPRVA